MDPVAVVGIGQTPYRPKHESRLEDLIFDASRAALEDAGIRRRDIDSVVLAASDQLDGRAISSMVTACAAGAYLKDEIKTADEGSYAVILAVLRILSGLAETALVVSWTKASENPLDLIMHLSNDPFFLRDIGINHVTSAALMAQAYSARYNPDENILADIVQKNRAGGARNPLAHLRKVVSRDAVIESPYVAWPLRSLHLAPYSDGACALVLTSKGRSREFNGPLAWIRGMGWASSPYWPAERVFTPSRTLALAAQDAYRRAGIHDPLSEFDIAEIHDLSAWHELIAYEGLQFCQPGEASGLVQDRITSPDGPLPVNPSGGVLSANPFFAAGLVRVAEAALQVSGRAGERQSPSASVAVAHASTGFAAQSHAVFVITRD